jgi:hypothetical protein
VFDAATFIHGLNFCVINSRRFGIISAQDEEWRENPMKKQSGRSAAKNVGLVFLSAALSIILFLWYR